MLISQLSKSPRMPSILAPKTIKISLLIRPKMVHKILM